MAVPDRALLASRIQGFGNVDPPPLEEERGSTLAKRAVGRLGDMMGEEVMLTVEDFREKGAVGAVKDAVADAGDILIDGVSGLIGWIRGDPPEEDDGAEATEDATAALSNGPAGAAYGISQASPTGGINAVWVMPEEADPSTLLMLNAQQGGLAGQSSDPRVPKNIQPYQPLPERGSLPSSSVPHGAPLQVPGGPLIAPYQPLPAGAPATPLPFSPGSGLYHSGVPFPRAGGYNASGGLGTSAASSAPAGASGAKVLVERIAKGEVIVGPDVARRLLSQCQATKTSGKEFAELICERIRRLYLGLDGGDPEDADEAMARLLSLADSLRSQPSTDLIRVALEEIRKGVPEELLSLRSCTRHKGDAEPMLQRLGLVDKAPVAVDLLGSLGEAVSSAPAAAPRPPVQADLLGSEEPADAAAAAVPAKEADLLGGNPLLVAPAKEADLLGGGNVLPELAAQGKEADLLAGAASATAATPAPATQAALPAADDLLGGVGLNTSAAAPVSVDLEDWDSLLVPAVEPAAAAPTAASAQPLAATLAAAPAAATPAPLTPQAAGTASAASPTKGLVMGTMGQGAVFPEDAPDAFGFIGAEMSRASGGKQ